MNKKLIRLTESDLHRIVKESVKRVLNESINDKLQFIIDIVKDLGDVHLSSKCGKYYALVDNGDSVVALKFVGANGESRGVAISPDLIIKKRPPMNDGR